MSDTVDYVIKKDIHGVDFNQVATILSFHGLSSFNAEMQKKVFTNSFAVVFLYEGDKIFGVGRAISDGISQAAIYNIALKEEFRGHGFGKVIIDELLNQVPGCNVILYTHPQFISLYEHWGFKRMKTGFAKFVEQDSLEAKGFI